MTEKLTLTPRPAIADVRLTRPDWTSIARDPGAALRLDKNENTDPILRGLIADQLSSIDPAAALDYPEMAPTYHLLARHLGVEAQNILIAAGSDGAIRAVFEAFISPGDVVVHTEPTFAMYSVYSAMFGATAVPIAYQRSNHGPSLSSSEFCAHILAVKPKLICLPNPDSPTGTEFRLGELETIVSTGAEVGALTLIDEAYFPFSDVTAIPLVSEFENLIVTRTFAKAWGLAGLRIGYLVAQSALAVLLHKVRPMYEVNGVAIALLGAMLDRAKDVEQSVGRINAGKVGFAERMRALGLNVLDGSGNFIHVDFGEARQNVHLALRGRVLYREDFKEPCLAGFSRFTTAPEPVMDSLADMI
ncbi:histidinol-phosphate aminotransferase family protein, partial [Alphaproteobacteria bacterium]|nr:histidinol-phosphate aminotransferase family protein [Alphaproteobacteria bacterium]